MRARGKGWRIATTLVSLALVGAILPACGGDDGPDGDVLRVVTTVAPITSIVGSIGGDLVEVRGIVPEGVDSHTYEPPPSVARSLSEADVLFYNGLGLEEPIEQMAEATMSGDGVMVALGEETISPDEYVFDFSFPEEGGSPNPHLWTNPPMGKRYGEVVKDILSRLDPDNAEAYAEHYDLLAERVDRLDRAMAAATETVPEGQRKLLTYHDAYPYFAKRYGWDVVGAVQPAHFGEPTASEVGKLIDQVRDHGVPAIFGSEVFPSGVLDQIARDTGAEYYDDLRDDDLPGAPGDSDHSWLALLRFNFVVMVEALGGDASGLEAVAVALEVPDTAHYPE